MLPLLLREYWFSCLQQICVIPRPVMGIATAGFLDMPDAVLDDQLQVSPC